MGTHTFGGLFGLCAYNNDDIVSDCSFSGSIYCEGCEDTLYIGGITSYFQGETMRNCENKGDIYVKTSEEAGWIEIGGILWEHDNSADIVSCKNSGNITVVGSSTTVDTSKLKNIKVGGIESTKYSHGRMEKCTNKGNITVDGCEVSLMYVGGIVGEGYTEGTLNNVNMGSINAKRCIGTTDCDISVRRYYGW